MIKSKKTKENPKFTYLLYLFQIRATDRDGDGNSSSANLTILVSPPVDVTTFTPGTDRTTTVGQTTTRQSCSIEFSPPSDDIILTEAAPVGVEVFHVRPTVIGGCSVAYNMTGKAKEYFVILDGYTGTVHLTRKLNISELKEEGLFDPELKENSLSFDVRILADDGNSENLSLVFRIVQRNVGSVLLFDTTVYNFALKEEEPAGTLVGNLSAKNLNGTTNGTEILYSVLFGENLFWMVNATRGDIVSKEKLDSDGSNPKEYSFVVQATQGNMYDFAVVSTVYQVEHLSIIR